MGERRKRQQAIGHKQQAGAWPTPDWEAPGVRLYCGDCLEILPTLPTGCIDAVVTDPPYGMHNNSDWNRFTGGQRCISGKGKVYPPTVGDDAPFDPVPFLGFGHVVLWGVNHYAAKLPVGTLLIWLKRKDHHFGTFLSDAEVAWEKGGCGVYVRRRTWNPFERLAIGEPSYHPNQKPVSIMRWCIERNAGSGIVLDPFLGSGTTGVACVQTGREFVGIEIEEGYFEIAVKRIKAELDQGRLPFEMEHPTPDP